MKSSPTSGRKEVQKRTEDPLRIAAKRSEKPCSRTRNVRSWSAVLAASEITRYELAETNDSAPVFRTAPYSACDLYHERHYVENRLRQANIVVLSGAVECDLYHERHYVENRLRQVNIVVLEPFFEH